ncbi:hypothetical protein DAPPUDRAFT_334852 [Daphnia pulex]|uniref:Uncharacterized protein n=1 Tax=Daphnia pulex TaxID=6669 RepID=E9HWJ5_DAPPU|nr:hypothetical protein DAPPUDRAFT_334852 [Daphnia pulex]|eukprot:EFX63884.1 hypothetical protein DAPPUDRAFT_334852 [Daphnia pulex]
MANLNTFVVRGREYTRIVRLDGRGDIWLRNGRVFKLDRTTLDASCAYEKLDIPANGGKFDVYAPACNAGHGVFCGHIVAPHAIAYADFWRALRLALCHLKLHRYPHLLKSQVEAVFHALKREFFGVFEFTLEAFWRARDNSIKGLRVGVKPWWYSADLAAELASYHEIRPLFRPFLDNYMERIPPLVVEPEEPEDPEDPLDLETPEVVAFRAAGEALARSLNERAVLVTLTAVPLGRGRGRGRPRNINHEYRF